MLPDWRRLLRASSWNLNNPLMPPPPPGSAATHLAAFSLLTPLQGRWRSGGDASKGRSYDLHCQRQPSIFVGPLPVRDLPAAARLRSEVVGRPAPLPGVTDVRVH